MRYRETYRPLWSREKQSVKRSNRGTPFSTHERDMGRTSIDERNCGTTMTSSTTSQYDVISWKGGKGWRCRRWERMGRKRVASSCARGRTGSGGWSFSYDCVLTMHTDIECVVVHVRAQLSPFNGGEQGRRLKRIDHCDIERRILTGGKGWVGLNNSLCFSDN